MAENAAIPDYFPVAKSKKQKKKNTQKDEEIKVVKVEDNANSDEEYLRQFDLDYTYGPSQNITRMERWERAKKLNLNPPLKVKELILSDERFLNPIWNRHRLLD